MAADDIRNPQLRPKRTRAHHSHLRDTSTIEAVLVALFPPGAILLVDAAPTCSQEPGQRFRSAPAEATPWLDAGAPGSKPLAAGPPARARETERMLVDAPRTPSGGLIARPLLVMGWQLHRRRRCRRGGRSILPFPHRCDDAGRSGGPAAARSGSGLARARKRQR